MKHLLALGGRWLAGTGGVTALGYLVATEAAGGTHPVWPYWVFGSMLVVGLALYLICQDRSKQDIAAGEETSSPDPERVTASDSGTVHNEISGGTFTTTGSGDTHNKIEGGVFHAPVVQGRDISGPIPLGITPPQDPEPKTQG